jgi:hypothetical protein
MMPVGVRSASSVLAALGALAAAVTMVTSIAVPALAQGTCQQCILDRCEECRKSGATFIGCEISSLVMGQADDPAAQDSVNAWDAMCTKCLEMIGPGGRRNQDECRARYQGQPAGAPDPGAGAAVPPLDPGTAGVTGAAPMDQPAGAAKIGNAAPYPPALVGPPNAWSPPLSNQVVTLGWINHGDPEGDLLTASLDVYRTQWSPQAGAWLPWEMIFHDWVYGNGFVLTPANGLVPGACYSWQVFVSDRSARSNPWFAGSEWRVFCVSP